MIKNIEARCGYGDCDKPKAAYSKSLCGMHQSRKSHGRDMDAPPTNKRERGSGYKNEHGYIRKYAPNHPNSGSTGYVMEHVMVMVELLGRPLYPGENVHHKNGVKDDNRPQNLELWVSHQPKGQRPEDLVAWAHEILERYEVDE